ncbi:MAG: L-threonylcarbamoyladenylate synthase [Bacteroidales bacterium]|jgi:L-threonylcarbamoyladenylate synthase|nr:L-threonylcarbamoyladenylate synthase [Bacteroidales bacterium]
MNHEIKKALEVLQNGGVILYPTDTLWGIGCDATHEQAVERIYRIKQRKEQQGMLVLLDQAGKIPSYVHEMPEIAWDLIELTGNPLTIIYPQGKNLAQKLMAADGSIGIRITHDPFTRKLIERFKKPIVSTSANISGEKPPGNFTEINPKIPDLVDYVVQWRQDDYSRRSPSGIIKLGASGEIKVIRE